MKFTTLSEEYSNMQTNIKTHNERMLVASTLTESAPLTKVQADELIAHYKILLESPRTTVRHGQKAQIEALRMLSNGDDSIVTILMAVFGRPFRDIIDEYEVKLGREPTAEDLIWITGDHWHEDPREVVASIKDDIETRGLKVVSDEAMERLQKHWND